MTRVRHVLLNAILWIILAFPSFAAELQRLVDEKTDIFTVGVSESEITVVYPERIDILTATRETELFSTLDTNQRAIISANGKYIGIMTFVAGTGEYMVISGFELYESSGKPLFKIEHEYHTAYYISNSGYLISVLRDVESPEFAKLYFYNRNGSRSEEMDLPGLQTFDFSPDGDTFVANTKTGVRAFRCPSGDPVWEINTTCQYFATSDAAAYTALVNQDRIRFYEQDQLLGEKTVRNPFPRDLSISANGAYTALADRWNLYLFETQSAQEVWHTESGDPGKTFVSVDINDAGTYILVGIDVDRGGNAPVNERHTRGIIQAYDRTGIKIFENEIRYHMWHYRTPHVTFLPGSERSAIIQTRQELYQLELPLQQDDTKD
ncbi:MAG: hypothetical protein D6675_16610 [Gemmatimonadetes bacterium]|nr:MAG: hypothetical protein D6675_16610 [Gemmatimonadota bacterium]